jgi:hypothetical protein
VFIATLLVARALLPGAAGGSGAPARSLELQKSERPPTATRMSKVLNDPAGDLLPAIGRPRTSAVLRVPGICAGNVDSVNARNWPSTDARPSRLSVHLTHIAYVRRAGSNVAFAVLAVICVDRVAVPLWLDPEYPRVSAVIDDSSQPEPAPMRLEGWEVGSSGMAPN